MSSTITTRRSAELDSGPGREAFADRGDAASAASASQRVAEPDANLEELKTKVSALVQSKFGGDYEAAFKHYDKDLSGVDDGELQKMLKDAGVGNGFTRGIWSSKIIEKMDGNSDGKISWQEFQAGLKA